MAKRFTDTEKWKDPWFDNLPGVAKLFFFYICDMVDCAGIWKTNFSNFKKNTGFTYTEKDFEVDFNGKVKKLDNGNYFLTGFIKFQYGSLRENNTAHKGVLKSLAYNGIEWNMEEGLCRKPSSVLARLSKKKKLQIMASDYFTCVYCGKHGDEHSLVIDHITPRVMGGGNEDDNLATACGLCNSKKGSFSLDEFVNRNHAALNLSPKIKLLIQKNSALKAPLNALKGAQDKDKDKDKDIISINNASGMPRMTPDAVVQLWNTVAGPTLGYCKSLGSGKHLQNFFAALEFLPDEQSWRDLFEKCLQSDFLSGKSDTNFVVSLTWLADFDNAVKVLNGNYRNDANIEHLFRKIKQRAADEGN